MPNSLPPRRPAQPARAVAPVVTPQAPGSPKRFPAVRTAVPARQPDHVTGGPRSEGVHNPFHEQHGQRFAEGRHMTRRGGRRGHKAVLAALAALSDNLPEIPAKFDDEKAYRVKLKTAIPPPVTNKDGKAWIRPSHDVIMRGDIAEANRENILGAVEVGSTKPVKVASPQNG